MKLKRDHRSKFSNLSNWKEEAWKISGLQRDLLRWSLFTFKFISENWKKVDQTICFQPRGDRHGSFTIKESGMIYTFKLVHQKGTISCYPKTKSNYWGCLHRTYRDRTLVTVITFSNNTVLPLADYAKNTGPPCGYYSYKIEGLGVHSKELVFNHLPTSLRVKTGQKFHVWYGGDLVNCGEETNEGETCADVYAWYAWLATCKTAILIADLALQVVGALVKNRVNSSHWEKGRFTTSQFKPQPY